VIDTTNPILSSSSPADNATGVGENDNIVLTFSENVVYGSSGSAGQIVIDNNSDLSDGAGFEAFSVGNSKISLSNNVFTINPAGTFASSEDYQIFIPSTFFYDAAGNNFAGITNATTLNFTSEDDLNPEVQNVTSTTANGNYNTNDVIAITITFNEAVTVSGTPQLTLETGSSDAVVNYSSGITNCTTI
jgi:hypothetical protein